MVLLGPFVVLFSQFLDHFGNILWTFFTFQFARQLTAALKQTKQKGLSHLAAKKRPKILITNISYSIAKYLFWVWQWKLWISSSNPGENVWWSWKSWENVLCLSFEISQRYSMLLGLLCYGLKALLMDELCAKLWKTCQIKTFRENKFKCAP